MIKKDCQKNIRSIGSLCGQLSQANIMIYHYENLKWWGRKNSSTSAEIDEWDRLSRIWCERRSAIKNNIDRFIKSKLTENRRNNSVKSQSPAPFQILPISLMIDMLTIENIKIYDLKKKKNKNGVKRASARLKALKEAIDKSIYSVILSKHYKLEPEARTF